MASVFPQWAQDLNIALGFVGFFITIVVMVQVWSLRRSFRTRARLPEIVRDMEAIGSLLSAALEGWPAKRTEARGHIKNAASVMQSADSFLNKPVRTRTKQIQRKLDAAALAFSDKKFDDPETVWDLYSDIQSVITGLNQISKNLRWD